MRQLQRNRHLSGLWKRREDIRPATGDMDVERNVNFYVGWRFIMWTKGYGSYRQIDEAVSSGKLVPGREYPSRQEG